MARVMKQQELENSFSNRTFGAAKYPWDEWLVEGQGIELTEEDFGGTDAKYVAHQARNTAARRGLKIRVSLDEKNQTVKLWVLETSEEEKAEILARMEARKEKQKAKKAAKNGTVSQNDDEEVLEEEENEVEEAPAPTKKGGKKGKPSRLRA